VIKFFITFVFVPMALWFNTHAFLDITYNGAPGRAPWDFFGKTFFEVRASTRRRCSGAILEPSVPGAHLAPVPGVCSTTCSC
jgi:hypothetical protein